MLSAAGGEGCVRYTAVHFKDSSESTMWLFPFVQVVIISPLKGIQLTALFDGHFVDAAKIRNKPGLSTSEGQKQRKLSFSLSS